MNNNLLQTIVQMVNLGKNPISMLQNMATRNPQIAQFLTMINGKNAKELQEIAENMCREKGTTPQEIVNHLGINFRQK